MARVTRADLLSQDPGEGVSVIEALAPLATGFNEDGTPYLMPVVDQVDSSVATNLTASGQANTVAVPQGMVTVSYTVSGTFVGTAQFEFSVDGGANYFSHAAARVDAAAGAIVVSATAAGVWEAAMPAGTTHVRIRCSAYTSGTIVARVSLSTAPYEAAVSANVTALPAVTLAASQTIIPQKNATGGLSIYRNISLGAGVNIKATAGALYTLQVTNLASSTRFVKFYAKATAPTVGTDTPVITVAIPAGASITMGAADIGAAIATGIGIACTQGVADSDTTLAAANEVVANLFYF